MEEKEHLVEISDPKPIVIGEVKKEGEEMSANEISQLVEEIESGSCNSEQ